VVKRVFKLSFDIEKQEAWVNAMAKQGWMMVSFFMGLFTFKKGRMGEYRYRCELLPYLAISPKNRPYLEFLESMEVEIVVKWLNQIVYRRKATEGPLEIYSDAQSRIEQYRLWSRTLFVFSAIELFLAFMLAGRTVRWIVLPESESNQFFVFLLVLFFALVVGILLFRAAWRFRKKARCLIRETLAHE
jgi:hypothetical protein